MRAQPWCRWEGTDLLLAVYVQPHAQQDGIVGLHGNALKIRITALPSAGQANLHLLRFMANLFAVPLTRVILISGATTRAKRIRVIAPSAIPPAIEQLLIVGNR